MTTTKEKATASTMAQSKTQRSNNISNAEFLKSLFPALEAGEYGWACSFAQHPDYGKWAGFAVTDFSAVKDYRHGNGYYSVAILKNEADKPRKRQKACFSRLPVVVADDFTGDAPCTYRLQTSAGKCQVCWKLDVPITDVGIAERLHKALAVMKLMPADASGNNVVRYVRLPVQINTKYQPNFAGELTHFEPEQIFTLKEVCDILGIDYNRAINNPAKAAQSHSERFNQAGDNRVSDAELIANLCKAEVMHESLNVLIARYVKRGMDEQTIREIIHGLMSAHDDGTKRYKARIGEIDRSLKGAIEKFAPKPEIDENPLFPELTNPFTKWAVPAFPMDCVPESIREFAISESAISGFDAGGYAVSSVFALSALIDQKARVRIADSYKQPPMLWFGLVSESGEGKSPVLNAGLQFVKMIDKKLQEDSLEAKREWAELVKDEKDKTPPPPFRQLVVSDTTVEALANVLRDNTHGVLMHSDELTRWIGQMDAYSGKGADKDRGNYLEAYDGGARVINRATKGNTFIPNWSMATMGGIQPEKLAAMFNKSSAVSSDGLYQRFVVYCLQPSKDMDLFAQSNPFTLVTLETVARIIFDWSESGVFTKTALTLSEETKLQFQSYANAMRRIQKHTPESRLSEHLGKYPGFVIRLAFALHVIECAEIDEWQPTLDIQTFERAKKIMACLFQHSESAYSKLSDNVKNNHLLQSIAKTILAKGWMIFTKAELTRHCKPWRDTHSELEKESAITKLIQMGWLLDVTEETRKPTGRMAQGKYVVNPEVHQRFADVAKQTSLERQHRFDAIKSAGIERTKTTTLELVD